MSINKIPKNNFSFRGSLNRVDFLETGKQMGLTKNKCDKIINKVATIVNGFMTYANENGLNEKNCRIN